MIELLVTDFLQYAATSEARQRFNEYNSRKKTIEPLLSEENIDNVKPDELEDVFRSLQTCQAHPSYLLILERYGLESLREHLKYFLYGSDPLEIRFDTFFEQIPEMPQLALMEVATFAQPRNFCIWDEAAKKTIIYIGHSRMHGLSETSFQEKIAGLDYVWAKLALNHVRQILSAYAGSRCDFVDVFFFTNFVYEKWVMKKIVDV
ncbi:MAG: hypothetical protein NZ581_03765 [Candidatus Caldarchaeum sp.]|nr:hypothetical protein [Candidatus Caldarchaeum sp.]MDW8435297.1 hypothetical protein [Candidatus Caldarchaeum sp.]